MLQNIPEPLRADAFKSIPSSMWATCTCCAIYDGYPRNKKKIDIAICLQGGKVLELYQREPVSYVEVPNVSKFKEIRILRNSKGELFYLVLAVDTADTLIILSSSDTLDVHRHFTNVTHYEICDPSCTGEPKLMIRTGSSTKYLSFNDFEVIDQHVSRGLKYTKPVITDLAKKLTEAKYNLQCNEKAYKKIETLRQHTSFLYREDVEVKRIKPIVTFCNKNIVIQLEVENPYDESMDNVCVLIHNNTCNAISYTNKVYEHLKQSPFYREIQHKEIKKKCKALIVAAIPIKEFENIVHSRIEFSVIISYEKQGKEYLQSFDSVEISAADVMGKNFDVFNSPEVGERNLFISMLSTTDKTTLCLNQKGLDVTDSITIFNRYLEMDLLGELRNVAVHKKSPHHILHGIMIVLDDAYDYIDVAQIEFNFRIDVYARSESQVKALIHFIYDKVPLALTVTTPGMRLSSDIDSSKGFGRCASNFDYSQCADSLLKQSSMTLKYLDDCLKEMNKTPGSLMKPNVQIDLFAMGSDAFLNYRNGMIEEIDNCVDRFMKANAQISDMEMPNTEQSNISSSLEAAMDID